MRNKTNRATRLAAAAAFVVMSLVLGACTASGGNQAGADSASELRVVMSAEPRSLNPPIGNVKTELQHSTQIMEPLVSLNDDFTINHEGLITEWERKNPNEWLLTVREDVRFSNGEVWDAAAAAKSIEFAGAAKNNAAYFSAIESSAAVDDTHVLLTTKSPTEVIPALLTWTYAYPPTYYAEVGEEEFGRKPIGTGPFVLDTWAPGQSMTLKKNPTYWGSPAGVDTIRINWSGDDAARVTQLQSGQADLIFGLPPTSMSTVKTDDNLQVLASETMRTVTLILNRKNAPFDDPEVRKAFAMALDREALTEGLFDGLAKPVEKLTLSSSNFSGQGEEFEPIGYDPEGAKAILSSLSYKPSISLTYGLGRYLRAKEVAQAVGGMLTEVGFDVKDDPMDANAFSEAVPKDEVPNVFMYTFAPLYPSDDFFAGLYWRSTAQHPQCRDAQFDATIDEARTVSGVDQADLYRGMEEQTLVSDICMLPLFGQPQIWGASKRVENFDIPIYELVKFADITLKE